MPSGVSLHSVTRTPLQLAQPHPETGTIDMKTSQAVLIDINDTIMVLIVVDRLDSTASNLKAVPMSNIKLPGRKSPAITICPA